MIFYMIGMIVGLMILVGGLYYFIKEKNDKESRKIYGIASIVGAVIVLIEAVYLVITKIY